MMRWVYVLCCVHLAYCGHKHLRKKQQHPINDADTFFRINSMTTHGPHETHTYSILNPSELLTNPDVTVHPEKSLMHQQHRKGIKKPIVEPPELRSHFQPFPKASSAVNSESSQENPTQSELLNEYGRNISNPGLNKKSDAENQNDEENVIESVSTAIGVPGFEEFNPQGENSNTTFQGNNFAKSASKRSSFKKLDSESAPIPENNPPENVNQNGFEDYDETRSRELDANDATQLSNNGVKPPRFENYLQSESLKSQPPAVGSKGAVFIPGKNNFNGRTNQDHETIPNNGRILNQARIDAPNTVRNHATENFREYSKPKSNYINHAAPAAFNTRQDKSRHPKVSSAFHKPPTKQRKRQTESFQDSDHAKIIEPEPKTSPLESYNSVPQNTNEAVLSVAKRNYTNLLNLTQNAFLGKLMKDSSSLHQSTETHTIEGSTHLNARSIFEEDTTSRTPEENHENSPSEERKDKQDNESNTGNIKNNPAYSASANSDVKHPSANDEKYVEPSALVFDSEKENTNQTTLNDKINTANAYTNRYRSPMTMGLPHTVTSTEKIPLENLPNDPKSPTKNQHIKRDSGDFGNQVYNKIDDGTQSGDEEPENGKSENRVHIRPINRNGFFIKNPNKRKQPGDETRDLDKKVSRIKEDLKTKKTKIKNGSTNQETDVLESKKQKVTDQVEVLNGMNPRSPKQKFKSKISDQESGGFGGNKLGSFESYHYQDVGKNSRKGTKDQGNIASNMMDSSVTQDENQYDEDYEHEDEKKESFDESNTSTAFNDIGNQGPNGGIKNAVENQDLSLGINSPAKHAKKKKIGKLFGKEESEDSEINGDNGWQYVESDSGYDPLSSNKNNSTDEFQNEEKVEKQSKTVLRSNEIVRNETSRIFGEKKTQIKDNKEKYHEAYLQTKDESKVPNDLNLKRTNLEKQFFMPLPFESTKMKQRGEQARPLRLPADSVGKMLDKELPSISQRDTHANKTSKMFDAPEQLSIAQRGINSRPVLIPEDTVGNILDMELPNKDVLDVPDDDSEEKSEQVRFVPDVTEPPDYDLYEGGGDDGNIEYDEGLKDDGGNREFDDIADDEGSIDDVQKRARGGFAVEPHNESSGEKTDRESRVTKKPTPAEDDDGDEDGEDEDTTEKEEEENTDASRVVSEAPKDRPERDRNEPIEEKRVVPSVQTMGQGGGSSESTALVGSDAVKDDASDSIGNVVYVTPATPAENNPSAYGDFIRTRQKKRAPALTAHHNKSNRKRSRHR